MLDGENDAAVAAAARENADFAAGFTENAPPAETPKPETAAPHQGATAHAREGTAHAREGTEAAAEDSVKISAKEWAEIKAAAQRSASHDQQLSKAFGTIGNLQKLIATIQQGQAPGAPRQIVIPKDAFAEMERDFPELAQHSRTALERAFAGLSGGLPGTGADDSARIKTVVASHSAEAEIEKLDDAYQNWREIVGVPAAGAQPDQNHPFRKWLARQDAGYQARLNATQSAAVITRAIGRFQAETAKAAPAARAATTPRDQARAERIRGAVQPRGDNGGAAAPSEDDEFIAGFNSR